MEDSKYNEALEKAKNEIQKYPKMRKIYEKVFPELNKSEESDDEKARRTIKTLLENKIEWAECGFPELAKPFKDALAWFEKQEKEDDEETDVQKAFREGKSAGRKEVFEHPQEYGLKKLSEKVEDIADNITFTTEFQKQVSHLIASVLNSEEEYTEGFVEYTAQSLLGYAKNELKKQFTKWSNEDEKMIENIILNLQSLVDEGIHSGFVKTVKEQQNWLRCLLQRFNLQPKNNWSKEDELTRLELIHFISSPNTKILLLKSDEQKFLNWLKSLPKMVQQWKPI